MPGTYVVNFSDPTKVPITLLPREANASTSMRMTGYLSPIYGETFWENFLHLLENFSHTAPPANPTRGQFWINTTTTPGTAYVYDDSRVSTTPYPNWHLQDTSGIVRSGTAPADTRKLWYDTTDKAIKFWVDSAWKSIIPISVPVAPPSPYLGQIWHDTVSGEVKFWSSGNQWKHASVPGSATLAPTDGYPGLMWYDTTRNVMRFHHTASSRWAITNLYSNLPDERPVSNRYNGQIWFDRTSLPATVRMFDDRIANPLYDTGEENWHTIKRGVVVGGTAPTDVSQLWYNPTVPKTFNYWTGTAWKNILWCATMAKACDYNKLAAQLNVELLKINRTPVSTVVDPVSTVQWETLFDAAADLGTYWNIPHPGIDSIVPPTTVTHCNDTNCGWHSILRKFENFFCALHYAEDSTTINPACEDVVTPSTGTFTRTVPWDRLVITATATFPSAADLNTFFAAGGKLRIETGITSPPLPIKLGTAAWRFALQQLGAVELTATQVKTAISTYSTSVNGLSATYTPVVYQPVARPGGKCIVSFRKIGGSIGIQFDFDDILTDGSIDGTLTVRTKTISVGAPCQPVTIPHPVIAIGGVAQAQRHSVVGAYVGVPLQLVDFE
jgi:hypothetical protein